MLQLSAADPDLPADSLAYWLGLGTPAGSALDPITGVFTWTLTEDQLGTQVFQALVSDDASPRAYSTEEVSDHRQSRWLEMA